MKNTPHFDPANSLERLSAAFDGEADIPSDIRPDVEDQMRTEWSAVSAALKSLPINDVNFVAAVRSDIDAVDVVATSASPLGRVKRNPADRVPVRVVRTSDRPAARRSYRSWMAVAGSVAALLLLVVLPWWGAPEFGPDWAIRAQALRSVQGQDGPITWNVVVLTLDQGADFDNAMFGVIGNAEQHGSRVMRLDQSRKSDAEFSAGVFLTSGAAPKVDLESLIHGESAEWNPVRIGAHDREELKQRFLTSLEVPSRSDDVFGTMFVVDGEKSSSSAVDASEAREGVTRTAMADDAAAFMEIEKPGEHESLADLASSGDGVSRSAPAPGRIQTDDTQRRTRRSGESAVLVIIRRRPPESPEALPPGGEPHGKAGEVTEARRLAA